MSTINVDIVEEDITVISSEDTITVTQEVVRIEVTTEAQGPAGPPGPT